MVRFSWTQKQNMGPDARADHAMTYDAARDRVVLFGGYVHVSPTKVVPVEDTWEWNGAYWTQVSDIGPSARANHVMVYDDDREQTILFGGNTSENPGALIRAGDTWAWDGEAWTQLDDTGPPPRASAAMAFDKARRRAVLFSGDAAPNDTWEWDGDGWTQIDVSGPPRRAQAGMTYDDLRERVVLFGGAGGPSGRLNDTWEYDGTTWTLQAHTGPRDRAALAIEFAGSRAILFGGETVVNAGGQTAALGDTWEWSGRFWTQRQDIGPAARCAHRMAYDAKRERLVLFGGVPASPGVTATSFFGDTWEAPIRPGDTSDPPGAPVRLAT